GSALAKAKAPRRPSDMPAAAVVASPAPGRPGLVGGRHRQLGGPNRARRNGLEAASPPFGSFSGPISSTPSMSPSRRSRSAGGRDSGPPTRTLLDRFHLESVPTPSGVTHLLFWRR